MCMIHKLRYTYDHAKIVSDYEALQHRLVKHDANDTWWYNLHKLDVLKDGVTSDVIEGTIFAQILADISKDYEPVHAMFRGLPAGECYRMHTDTVDSIHVPITPSPDFYYIYEDAHYTMDADGSVYFFDASKRHTACNAGLEMRVNFFIWVKRNT